MKLISLNVALFETNNSKIAKFLNNEHLDIACFQEVTRRLDKNVSKEYLSKDVIDKGTSKLEYGFFGPVCVYEKISAKNFHGQENFFFDLKGKLELGNYLRSRYEIKKAQNIFLDGEYSNDLSKDKWPDEQHRAMSVVDLILANKLLRIINYHGIWTRDKKGNNKTLKACRRILYAAKEFQRDVIICGDFNLFPDTPSMKLFNDDFISLVNKYKIDSTRPTSNELNGSRNVVDYILISKSIKVNDFKVVDNDISDHLPLVLDFDLTMNLIYVGESSRSECVTGEIRMAFCLGCFVM